MWRDCTFARSLIPPSWQIKKFFRPHEFRSGRELAHIRYIDASVRQIFLFLPPSRSLDNNSNWRPLASGGNAQWNGSLITCEITFMGVGTFATSVLSLFYSTSCMLCRLFTAVFLGFKFLKSIISAGPRRFFRILIREIMAEAVYEVGKQRVLRMRSIIYLACIIFALFNFIHVRTLYVRGLCKLHFGKDALGTWFTHCSIEFAHTDYYIYIFFRMEIRKFRPSCLFIYFLNCDRMCLP